MLKIFLISLFFFNMVQGAGLQSPSSPKDILFGAETHSPKPAWGDSTPFWTEGQLPKPTLSIESSYKLDLNSKLEDLQSFLTAEGYVLDSLPESPRAKIESIVKILRNAKEVENLREQDRQGRVKNQGWPVSRYMLGAFAVGGMMHVASRYLQRK